MSKIDIRSGRREFLRAAGVVALGGAASGLLPRRLTAVGCRSMVKRGNPSQLNVVAIGDSIMWGQGLLDAHKFTFRARDWLAARMSVPATLSVFARSGAIIGAGPSGSEPNCWVAGEIPDSNPTVWLQANVAAGNPQSSGCILPTRPAVPALDVDLVLVDGGINDIDVTSILDPTGAPMATLVHDAAETRMEWLLTNLPALFPNAKFVVTGYFPIVSTQTDLGELGKLLAAFGLAVGALVGGPGGAVTGGIIAAAATPSARSALASRSMEFHSLVSAALQRCVDRANARVKRDDFAFAEPGFGPANAYAAPQTWLFKVGEEDPARAGRVPACRAAYGELNLDPDRIKCWNASMGHPTPNGADAYSRSVTAALETLFPFCP
ncbi:MAG: hypothetical protein HOQ11_13425 [Gemmatimonadaceae bacterium]|nr:hypothetical protein [Gemmatimonadaceae bacterium]NUQ93821.1 hypothetical protein [Gemmatimonadaceae bacterium]NUR19225.1 hypothetical protein [Gemmatimonadaceae bacterium]NUS98400.1 hypothetical protein [Gemmatimonadaceae bacterium]